MTDAKIKAFYLIKISFDKIANASNYKGVEKDNAKQFHLIEEIAKKIALDFVDEIIKSHIDWSTEQDECVEFWNLVKSEIIAI